MAIAHTGELKKIATHTNGVALEQPLSNFKSEI